MALAVPKETKIGTPKCLFSLTICAKTNLSTFKNNSVEILLFSNRQSVQENGPRYTQWTMMDTMDHNGLTWVKSEFPVYSIKLLSNYAMGHHGGRTEVGLEESRAQKARNGDDAPCCHAIHNLGVFNTNKQIYKIKSQIQNQNGHFSCLFSNPIQLRI